MAARTALRNASLAPAALRPCTKSSAGAKSIPRCSIAFAPVSSPSPSRTKACTWSCVKGFCCAQAGRAKTNVIASVRKVSVLRNLNATSRGCHGLREMYGRFYPTSPPENFSNASRLISFRQPHVSNLGNLPPSLCPWRSWSDGKRARMTGAAINHRSRVRGGEAGVTRQINVEKRKLLDHRAAMATADAMSSVAARSFGVSTSVMRPTSPYLKAPPLAHSTTSPMPCFLVVATRRAAVRNSLRSWLNPEPAADPLPLLLTRGGAASSAAGLADPFLPVGGAVVCTGRRIRRGLRRGSCGTCIGRRTCRRAFAGR